MLTRVATGKTAGEIADLRRTFVDGLAPDAPPLPKELGDLRAMAGVRRFPSRIRCAVLPFDALEDALRQNEASRDRIPVSASPATGTRDPRTPSRSRPAALL